MEIELERAKLDLMDLDGQLKEAIDQKLQLSQQLEQWKVGHHDAKLSQGTAGAAIY